jgi:hypothetical protein
MELGRVTTTDSGWDRGIRRRRTTRDGPRHEMMEDSGWTETCDDKGVGMDPDL